MGTELLIPLITGLATVIAGFFTTLLAKRRVEEEKIQKEKAEQIAVTVSSVKAGSDIIIRGDVAGRDIVGGDKFTVADRREITRREVAQDWELIQDLVNGYHQQALQQAKVQFWFSVVAASVGFGYILYAGSSITGTEATGYFKILPGVVIDAVALLFFRQAEQTRERATALYDRLRTDSQSVQAVALVDSIEDVQIKSAVKAQLALHMSGLTPKEIDLSNFLTKLSGNNEPKA